MISELAQDQLVNKDLYFGTCTDQWLSELCHAKKQLQDVLNAAPNSGLGQ